MQSVTQLIKKQPFPRVVWKAVSKNFAAFIEKHLKEAPTWLFYCELCKFFRSFFFCGARLKETDSFNIQSVN